MKNFKYKKDLVFIFFFLFFSGLFCHSINKEISDSFWNYSFTYSISKGSIPYVDFNVIVPIFYHFLGSLFLKVFGTGYHIYILYHTILMTFLFYLLFKLYEKKAYIFLFLIIFSYFLLIQPTYNSFLLVLFFSIIYLEKREANDYLIGLIIGLAICTKFTIGAFFFLPSLLYFKTPKKIFKRIGGILLPILLFFLYLLINNNYREFFDLCILGLFNFEKSNSIYTTNWTFIFIGLVLLLLVRIFKNKKNIYNYYALFSMMFALPIIDAHHMYFFIFCLLVAFMDDIKMKDIYAKTLIIFSIFAFFYMLFFYYDVLDSKRLSSTNSDFKYYFTSESEYKKIRKLIKEYKKYYNATIITHNHYGAIVEMYYHKKTNYLQVFLKGNYGYKEEENIFNYIKKKKLKYFFIKDAKSSEAITEQYFFEVAKKIRKDGKFIKKCGEYEIYLYE